MFVISTMHKGRSKDSRNVGRGASRILESNGIDYLSVGTALVIRAFVLIYFLA
jgi:hypothetical protein